MTTTGAAATVDLNRTSPTLTPRWGAATVSSPRGTQFSLPDAAAASPLSSINSTRISRRRTRIGDVVLEEDGGDENVQVCIRVRPFNQREMELQQRQAAVTETNKGPLRSVVAMPEGLAGKVVMYDRNPQTSEYREAETFQFTKSFWSVPDDQQPHTFAPVSQEDVYECIGRPMIRYAFAGFHNCVFAYGQTGSGKTFTMMGDFQGAVSSATGLIPRLCVELFEKVEQKRQEREEGILKTIEVKLSAIEIYNEQVRDLFWRQTPGRSKGQVLKIRKYPGEGGFFVDQLTILKPLTWLECLKLIDKAVAERTVAATDMNDESSRSHCIFQLILEQSETVHVESDDPDERYSKPVTNTKISKINLVDLAGSERLKKSNAQGQQLKEAAGINLSLTTLKKVIDALVINSKEATSPSSKKHSVMIPFRESSLTMLLSDSLGGNSKTTMIACVSPHYDNAEETLLTLRYASRTGSIVNHARINEDSAAKQALRLKHEILELQRRLSENPVDEEAEELRDQIEVGRRSLTEMEDASKKVSRAAAELREKSKQTEEAIMSSAFYNSMKMALLQQQREEMERSAVEMESRIQQHRTESTQLAVQMREKEAEERAQVKQLVRLRSEANDLRMRETLQEQQNSSLTREAHELQRKMDREIELRYAQKMVNAFRLKKARQAAESELAALTQEHERKLTQVIFEAAEQYELQVRQFADGETIVHQNTTKAEREMQDHNAKRIKCEEESAVLMTKIRSAERQHAAAIQALEQEWKEKYQSTKEHFEEELKKADDHYFQTQKARDEALQTCVNTKSHDHELECKDLEARIRREESEWNEKIANLFETKAEEMDAVLRQVKEGHAMAASLKRKQYEKRISDLVAEVQYIRALEQEHDALIAEVQKTIAPLMTLHDAISLPNSPSIRGGARRAPLDGDTCSGGSVAAQIEKLFFGYSPEYIALRKLLIRFDGKFTSVKPKLLSNDVSVASGGLSSQEHVSPMRKAPITVGAFEARDGPVFPIAPIGFAKLSKTTYVDAQAVLCATAARALSTPPNIAIAPGTPRHHASGAVSPPGAAATSNVARSTSRRGSLASQPLGASFSGASLDGGICAAVTVSGRSTPSSVKDLASSFRR